MLKALELSAVCISGARRLWLWTALRMAGQVGLGASHHCSRFLLQKARHLPEAVGWGPPYNRGDFSAVAETPGVESKQEAGHRACPLLPESWANSEEAPACGWKTAEAAEKVKQACCSHRPTRRLTPAGPGPPPRGVQLAPRPPSAHSDPETRLPLQHQAVIGLQV